MMPFPIHIDLLQLILKGLLIGVIASAPMGPVGVLCIQRTLNKGRWYGFVTGLGAAASDIIYALITGLGMSFVMDLITNPTNKFWLQISGSVLLLVFGIYCWRSNPTSNMHRSGKQKGTLWLVDKVRVKFDESGILILNKIIGSVVIVFSLVVLIGTVFNLYTLHY